MILGLLFLIGFSFKSKLTLDFSLLNKSCRRTCTTYSFRLFKRPANNSNFYKVGFVCLFRQHNIPNGKLGNFSIKNSNQTFIFEQTKKILRDKLRDSLLVVYELSITSPSWFWVWKSTKKARNNIMNNQEDRIKGIVIWWWSLSK